MSLFLKGRERERDEVEERLQKWRVCPSSRASSPREERRNFKADKQEVCIIPLVPEEGREGRERETETETRKAGGRQALALGKPHV